MGTRMEVGATSRKVGWGCAAADTVTPNISYEGLLLMVLLIMIRKTIRK